MSNNSFSRHQDKLETHGPHSALNLRRFSARTTRIALFVAFATVMAVAAMWNGRPVHAAAFSSTQSGSWSDPATWGGGGFPGCGDDVTINNTHTVTLDTTRCSNNLTINSGGTLDLLGQQFSFANDGATFTNNGTLANTGGFNTFYFVGNGFPGGITQSFGGAGTYSGNTQIRVYNVVTLNVAASTSLTYNSATNNTNFQVDSGSILNLTNAMNFIAPSSGAAYVGFYNAGNAVSGAGGLKTQGNVTVTGAAGDPSFTAPLEIVSGAANGSGSFSGPFTIDNAASFKLNTTLNLYSNLTIPTGATLDLNGQALQFFGNSATFTNNGTLTNTGGFNAVYLYGNGTPGGITQNFAGAGTYSGNTWIRVYNVVTLNVAASTSLTYNSATNNTNFQVDSGSTLNLTNAMNFIAPSSGAAYVGFYNGGNAVSGVGGLKTQGNVTITGASANPSFTAPLEIVSGAANGSGNFSGLFKIDSNASFQMNTTLNLYNDLTIQSNATIDMNGQVVQFFGNNKTVTNNGTLTNTSVGFNTFLFFGNGVSGGIAQNLAGSGTYGSNLGLRVFNCVTVTTAAATSLNNLLNLQVDGCSVLDISNGLTLAGPPSGMTFAVISNGGTIQGGTLMTQGNVQISSSGTFSSSLEVVNGTTQTQGNLNGAVTIDTLGTLKLTSTLNLFGNLTIQSTGTIEMNGQALYFQGNGTTFTNNGLLTNAAGFNTFYFYGSGTPGGITQSFGGVGAYSGNSQIRVFNCVTLNVAPSTSLTYNSATNNTNFQVDSCSTLNLTNAMNFIAPSSGGIYVGFYNAQTVSGAGGLKTQGNVSITGAAGSPNFTAPVEIVSGAAVGSGSFDGFFTIDNGASFKLNTTLNLYSDLTIQSGATLDFNGQALQFFGNNAIFANNGSVTNTAGFNTLYFYGNGTPGGVTQHLATSTGTVTDNLQERLFNSVTVLLDGDAQLGSVQIDGGSTLNITNRTLKLSGPGGAILVGGSIITTGSTIELNGTAAQSVQTNLNGSSFNNLTINNSAGVDIPNPNMNPLSIPGTLTLTKGLFTLNGNLTMANGSVISRSNGSIDSAPTFGLSLQEVRYTETSPLINITTGPEIPVSNTVLNNLTINNSGGVTLGASLTVNGTMFLTNGALSNGGANTLTMGNGTTITRDVGSIGFAPTFGASVSVNYVGTTGVTTGPEIPSAAGVLSNLTINKSGGVNLGAGGATVNSTLFLTNGTFAVGSSTLVVNNGITVGAGTLTSGTTGTVNYNQQSNGQSVLAINYGNLIFSNFNKTLPANTVGIASSFSPGTGIGHTITGNTIDFNGAGAETIPAFNYNHLTSSNIGARTLASSGTIGVAGVFTPGANTYTVTGSTVNFNGGGSQTLPVFNYFNLTSSNSGGRTLASSGIIKIAGTFTPGGNSYTITGSTVEYNGSGSPQALPSTFTTYNNLNLNNTAGTTGFAGLTVNGLIEVKAGTFTSSSTYNNVQIDSGATLAGTNGTTINVSGNWTNNGTFTANTNTVNFNGGAAQTIGGSASTTFNNLQISNTSGGVSLNSNAQVDGTLTLTSGALNVSSSTLTINNGVTVGAGSLASGTTGTVNYNQQSNGQSVLAINYGNLTFSNFNKILPAGTIGIAGTFTPGSATGHTITGNTINFNGSGSQTIPAFNYNNLTSSNIGARTLASSGTIGIAGTFTPGTNVYTITGSTIDFNGSGSQTIAAFNYNNLTSSNSGARTLASSGTVGIAGTFTPGTNSYTIAGSTVEYNGTSPQTLPATFTTYNNLSLNNIAGVTGFSGLIVNNLLEVKAGTFTTSSSFNNVQIDSGATLAGTNGTTMNVSGNWTNGGTFTANGNTVNFNGAAAQTIGGSNSTTFNNLQISNTSGGVGLGVSEQVDGTLTLTSGALSIGGNTLTLNGAISSGGGTLTGGNTSNISFGGAGASTTLPAVTNGLNNLTINRANGISEGADLTLNGTLTLTSGAFSIGGNTLTLNGAISSGAGTLTGGATSNIVFGGGGASTTLPAVTNGLNNLMINRVNGISLGASLTVGGTLTLTSGPLSIGGNTLTLNGLISSGGGTLTGGNTSNITFGGAGASTTLPAVQSGLNNLTINRANGILLGASLTVAGTLNLTNGALSIGANTLTLNGLINSGGGTLVGGSTSNITFGGAGPSTTLPAVTNGLGNLTINRANGIALGASLNVSSLLTLTSGDLDTGANTLTMPSTASSAGTTDVVGNVTRTGFSVGAALSFGNPFNTIQVTSGSAPANINVNLVKSVPTGFISFPNAVQRTYTITPSASGFTGTLRLHYLDSELNGNTEGPNLQLWRFDNNINQWRRQLQTGNDTSANWVEKTGVTEFSSFWTLNSTVPTASNSSISGIIRNPNGTPLGGVVLQLTGGRRTITRADGTYQFDEVPTNEFYTLTPLLANHSFIPTSRSFSLTGNVTDADFSANADANQNANPLDTDMYFVRQQYLDILGREPDEGGLQYWTTQVTGGCTPGNVQCLNARRVDVAAAFFIALEFQQSGSYIYNVYSGTLGRRPAYVEYAADRRQVIGGPHLDEEKDAFARAFVVRPEFVNRYQSATTAELFVDALIQNVLVVSGVDLNSERDAMIARYNSGANQTESRGFVVRDVADNAAFRQSQYNPAFVLTEYFGYLRRDPEPDGYAFWLDVLNRNGGNYRGMVCSFITSTEYQARFATVITHNNGECSGP